MEELFKQYAEILPEQKELYCAAEGISIQRFDELYQHWCILQLVKRRQGMPVKIDFTDTFHYKAIITIQLLYFQFDMLSTLNKGNAHFSWKSEGGQSSSEIQLDVYEFDLDSPYIVQLLDEFDAIREPNFGKAIVQHKTFYMLQSYFSASKQLVDVNEVNYV